MLTKINIDATRLNNRYRREKMSNVALELHTVINSMIFRDKIMRMRYYGERSKYRDSLPAYIYQMIMQGNEIYGNEVDHELDIFVDDFYTFKNTIGYTTRNTKMIYVNTKYFDRFNSAEVGANILHEYGHKLGFSHDKRYSEARDNSICYLLGDIYKECHYKLFGAAMGPVKMCSRSWRSLWIKRCKWIGSIE